MSLSPPMLSALASDAEDLSACYSLQKKNSRDGGEGFSQIAVAALPSLVPRAPFEEMVTVTPLFNELYLAVSRDHEFLYSRLSGIEDGFTERLVALARAVDAGPSFASPSEFGICRSDYMLQSTGEDSRLLQVEFNTISSGLFTLCERVTLLHSHLLVKYGNQLPPEYASERVERSDSIRVLGNAFLTAYQTYPLRGRGAILYVIQEREWNICDQRLMECYLSSEHHLVVLRKTLSEIAEEGEVDSEGNLRIDGYTIVIAYLRAGYTPQDYPTEREWAARLRLERSRCIKCPNIFLHLAGAKKIQQALAVGGVTERFLPADKAARVRRHYAGLWDLQDEAACQRARDAPDRFVLKPQREGGGNNLFGVEISAYLNSLTEERRASHILMEKIVPAPKRGVLVKAGKAVAVANLVDEFGAFSALVASGERLLCNRFASYLVRSKSDTANEGGVAIGRAGLSSVILV